ITGAGSGIGQAIALELARQGAKIALADVNGEAADTTARQAREHSPVVMALAMDVSRSDEVRKGVAAAEARLGPLDALVNIAGILDRKSTRLNSSHEWISYAVLCLKKKRQVPVNELVGRVSVIGASISASAACGAMWQLRVVVQRVVGDAGSSLGERKLYVISSAVM